MPALESELRRQLENVIIQARDVAEGAARSALQKRAVDADKPFPHFGHNDQILRNRLRARGRQVGDVRHANGTQPIEQLTKELAYEYWHRMLFARFLAENHLLMHPDGVAVSLEECQELAAEAEPPAANGYVLAARYASRMLPQIFRTDDVLLEIEFAHEQRLPLEKLLASLPAKTFHADDSLGWVYQFWQTNEKDRVNRTGDKIDGRTLPAVTQLFTEPYMVQFLLHNTIGAWWCARHGIHGPAGGAGLQAGKVPVEMEYLRWREDGTPAAGAFGGWPKPFAEFSLLDPSCGSGHFLVSAFNLLVPLRMHDEKLSPREACDAVLRENIHGLELDPRCTQIAAFALALAAWKYPGENGEPLGYRELPPLNIACSGQGVAGKKEDWVALANGDITLRNGMERLYELFEKAPHLGSLIDPRRQDGDLFTARHAELDTLLRKALTKHTQDADLSSVGVAAQGITAAADLLTRQYTLVATNVPYLARGKQHEIIQKYSEDTYPDSVTNLATTFLSRCLTLTAKGGSMALVSVQSWLFQVSYKQFRRRWLTTTTWNCLSRLGMRAFQTQMWDFATSLVIVSNSIPNSEHMFLGFDADNSRDASESAQSLISLSPVPISQKEQEHRPDHVITMEQGSGVALLGEYASSLQGIKTGDDERVRRCFWEVGVVDSNWRWYQSTVSQAAHYSGLEHIIWWGDDGRGLARRQGIAAWGKIGVAVTQMSGFPVAIYLGHPFDSNMTAIIPKDKKYLPAIYAFCRSTQFAKEVRVIDQALKPTNSSFVRVPFDLKLWQSAPNVEEGIPISESFDPTQWIFKNEIASSTDPMQVAVARLLGYRWPDQPKEDAVVDPFVDADGIVCLPGVRQEAPAHERLADLLRGVRYKTEVDLAVWLRDKFFEEHCKRFHQRPFIWHIWDGRKDGFAALVNYHKLTYKTLENLTYSYLGDWITAQTADAKADKTGAGDRLAAAQALKKKLKLILDGEPPYDIFVRWKPLHEQAIGWHPDLNDGVRMNIRPFVEADILRKTPNIKWTKDRGKEPQRDRTDYPWFWSGSTFSGERVNDVHLTHAEKQAARDRTKGAK